MKLILTIITIFVLCFLNFGICEAISRKKYIPLFETRWWWPLLGAVCGQIGYWIWWH